MHPLAGQGLNMGIGDVAALAEALAASAAAGQDIGAANVLAGYDRERRAANLAMSCAVDGIGRMFAVGSHQPSFASSLLPNALAPLASLLGLPLVASRNAGLSLLDALGPVKELLVRFAGAPPHPRA